MSAATSTPCISVSSTVWFRHRTYIVNVCLPVSWRESLGYGWGVVEDLVVSKSRCLKQGTNEGGVIVFHYTTHKA